MSSVEGKIERRIKSRPRGTILFAGDFVLVVFIVVTHDSLVLCSALGTIVHPKGAMYGDSARNRSNASASVRYLRL